MAKNIFQTKKRVSHFQKTHKEIGENELDGCKDYVSSIIHDMDLNFNLIQSGYPKRSTECEETHLSAEDISNIPLLKFPSTSCSNETLIPSKHKRSKGFSSSRKFPLMEKSQKILKQLKHNQNIPKPRAHLAGLPKSPAKSKPKYISPKLSAAKKKEIVNVKNIKAGTRKVTSNDSSDLNVKCNSNSTHCKTTSNNSSALNNKNSISNDTRCKEMYQFSSLKVENTNLTKTSKDGFASKHSDSKKNEDTSGKSSCTNISSNIDSDKEMNPKFESNSSDSDSEYERFVKKSKMGLRKKSSKRQKQNKRSESYSKKSKKRKLARVSKQKNTYDCDKETRTCVSSKIGAFTTPKIVEADECLKNDSDHDDFPDMSTIDSSSDNDSNEATSATQHTISQTNKLKPFCENTVLLTKSLQSKPESNIDDLHSVCSGEKTRAIKSNINSTSEQNENILNSIKIEPDSLSSNLVIDICDSDGECNTNEFNAPELLCSENISSSSTQNSTKELTESDSEESDLEIIEEVKKIVQIEDKYSALQQTSFCLDNVVSGKHLELQNLCVDVKTENSGDKFLNDLPVVINQKEAEINKQDVVYQTDICYTKMIKQETISNNCNKTHDVPFNRSMQENSNPASVKQEIDSDDDIVILDSFQATKVTDALNLPPIKTENIKSEQSASEHNLKLHDTSVLINDVANVSGKKIHNVIPVSSAELLEWYKMEFETYKEMKQANADVEASLKNLQARQTQKMLYVRNLLHKCVKNNIDSKPPPVSAPQEILPSSVVQDIKPDVYNIKEEKKSLEPKIGSNPDNLDRKIVPKIESDDKQMLKLLNKKCSVCGKDAVAACQRCAKVFFCSPECGRKFWIDGHVNVCGTK